MIFHIFVVAKDVSPYFTSGSFLQLPPPMEISITTTVSVQFLPEDRDGLMLYAGLPLTPRVGQDFVAIGLEEGIVLVFIDLGKYYLCIVILPTAQVVSQLQCHVLQGLCRVPWRMDFINVEVWQSCLYVWSYFQLRDCFYNDSTTHVFVIYTDINSSAHIIWPKLQ